MVKDEGRKARCMSQQAMIYKAENEILKKKLQELQGIQNQCEQILNSRKYKLMSILSGTQNTEEDVFGKNGENLTGVFFADDRIFSLLDSVFLCEPQFAGEIVVAADEKNQELKDDLENYLKNKVHKYKIHLVGDGKNRYAVLNDIVEKINTEWMMHIDENYLVIRPFMEALHEAYRDTGCHFINLPVRDEKTGWIFDNQLSEKTGMADGNLQILDPETPRFSRTIEKFAGVLNAHALVLKKETFECFGKFDLEYQGLEALELAYRIRKNEYAIGNCKSIFLNCEKREQKTKEYDKNIVNRFKEEYGPGITNDAEIADGYQKKENRLRVAIIADAENWSYHNIAKQVQSCLKDEMDTDIFFYEYTPNAIQLILSLKDYDIIHFMWRGSVFILSEQESTPYLQQIGMTYDEFKKNHLDKICITTSVYDHLLLESGKERNMTECLLGICDEYTVSSEKLSQIYCAEFEKKPLKSVTDGVDLERFYPNDLERFEDRKDKNLVIGWVGNSQFWGMKDKDLKGVNTILKPAIEELKQEGIAVERYFADRQERMIPHDEMCQYYSKVDILICTSIVEGTPNPVLEAMACGVPIISTDVGIVPEALGEFQKQFILEERSIECLKKAIQVFDEHPEYLKRCSQENLERIARWSWKYKTQDFKEFFEESYRKHGKDKF